eukprot:1273487-Lingulodinium_polyedra.AAC.1
MGTSGSRTASGVVLRDGSVTTPMVLAAIRATSCAPSRITCVECATTSARAFLMSCHGETPLCT